MPEEPLLQEAYKMILQTLCGEWPFELTLRLTVVTSTLLASDEHRRFAAATQ